MLVAAAVVVPILVSGHAAAGERGKEALTAKILLRALAYDRDFKLRAGASVTVAIVFRREDLESVVAMKSMGDAFSKLAKLTFMGLPMKAVTHAYTDAAALTAFAKTEGVDVLYICKVNPKTVAEIITVSRSAKIATATSDTDYVRAGVSIGVTIKENVPRLLVNLPASKAEGLRLSADLMRIAEVIQ